MKLNLAKGSISNILQVFIRDSSSTTGGGLTGLVFNSGSLTTYYHRDTDTTATTISLVTMTIGTFTSSGFKEIDATNMPGWYQFCPPNAAFASGANNVSFHLKGATNMAPLPVEIQLVSYDPYDSVHLGLTSLPNAAASAVGGLPLSVDTSGRVDILKINGTSQTARDIGASVLVSSGTGTGQLDFTSGIIKSNLVQILGTALTETAGLLAGGFKKFFNVASPVLTCLGVDQTGDSYARIGSAGVSLTNLGDTRIANLDATISSRLAPAGTLATVTALTNAPTAGDFTAAMKTSLNSATPASVVGAVGSVTAAVTVGTNSDKTGYALTAGEHTNIVADINSALDAAGTELATIPGSTATLRQKISAVWQYLMFKRTTTTTIETMYKADNTTSLGTSTVSDDGTTATHGKIA